MSVAKILQNSEFDQLKEILSPHTKRAYLVGGSVRDAFWGIANHDYDVEIYDISSAKFDEIMSQIGALGVGKSYFVYKWKNFDLALARTESKIGVGHKAFEVSLSNDEKIASKRRDFTINSLLVNIFDGEILDFWGGLNDLKRGILRIVDKSSFIEDSLRVLRAVQFVARFNLSVEENSLSLMRDMDILDLSRDRVRVEMMKLFRAKNMGLGLRLLYDLRKFESVFGEKISPDLLEKTAKSIDEKSRFVCDEMLFLYILVNENGYDMGKILDYLNLSRLYKKLLKEPYVASPSHEDLLEIALKTPLCHWLGCYDESRIEMAKSLNIYESKFSSGVKSIDVVNDGFSGSNIAKEIQKREKIAIKNYLEAFDLVQNSDS